MAPAALVDGKYRSSLGNYPGGIVDLLSYGIEHFESVLDRALHSAQHN